MYEIWLGLNILWEIALANLAFVAFYGVVLLVLHAMALGRSATRWRRSLTLGTVVAGVLAIVALFIVPGATDSSFANLRGVLDWAALLGLSMAVGVAGGLLAWPLIALLRRGHTTTGD